MNKTFLNLFVKNLAKLILSIVVVSLISKVQVFSQTITVVDGNSGSSTNTILRPANYNSYDQIIYPQSLIANSGNITSIQLEFYDSGFGVNMSDIKIYMGHTSSSTFSSTSNWFAIGSLTQVFSGSRNFSSSGWHTFTLSTPFAYNNVDNLIIAIDKTNATDYSSGSYFYEASSTGNTALRSYRDSPDINPSAPITANQMVNRLPSLKLTIVCSAPTSVTLSNFTTPICSGTSPGICTATATGGSGSAYSYLWYKDGVSTGITDDTYAPGNLTANTNVYCAVSTGVGCTTNSAAQTITVNTIPTGVTAAATPNPVCPGATLTLTGSATGATSWNWTGPNSFASIVQSPTIPGFAAANEGVYSLVATNTCGSATSANTANVTLSSSVPSAVSAIATPNPICVGSTLNLTGSALGATSWSWTGPNGFTSTLQNPTIAGITAAEAGVYTLVASNCFGSAAGVNTASVVVTSGVPTSVTATASPNPVNQGSTLNLTGSASGATNWSWTGPNGFSSSSQNPVIPSITISGSGVYTLTASNACGAASAVNTSSVVVRGIWYVDNNSNLNDVFTIGSASGSNAAAGTSSNPFATLTYAVSVASAGDIIYVDAGTYTTDISILLNNSKSGISIIGAGSNLTIFDRSASTATSTDWFIHINTDNVTLKNFSVQGYENQGTQTTAYESGQAITIGGDADYDNNILLQNVIFNQNGQSGGNAALDVLSNSNVHLIGGGSYCNVWQTAFTGGIGVMGTNINLLVENYILAYNFKEDSYDGAGLRIEGNNTTNVTLKNTRISNNVAVNGGGIALFNGNLTITDCIFEANVIGQVSDNIYGAAIYISAGTATIKRSKFLSNTENASGTLRGGAIACRYNNQGSYSSNKSIVLTVDSCLFSGNKNDEGRDIYGANGWGESCNITVRDCQFLTAGDFNIVSDASSPASSINVTYFGTLPTRSGSNVTRTLSSNTLYTPAPSPPQFSGTCGSIQILPIELMNFEGACEFTHTHLWWSTASEHNNDHFTIERAGNNGAFYELATVNGNMNTTQKTDYSFADYYAEPGVNYYRLSQADVDGKERVLKTITVENNCLTGSGLDISCWYDGQNNSVEIGYLFEDRQILEAQIVNMMGQVVSATQLVLDPHDRKAEIKLNYTFSNGMYFLRLSNNSIQYSEKFLIGKQ